MNILTNPNKLDRIQVEKISRRSVLKGLGITARALCSRCQ